MLNCLLQQRGAGNGGIPGDSLHVFDAILLPVRMEAWIDIRVIMAIQRVLCEYLTSGLLVLSFGCFLSELFLQSEIRL